VFPVVKVRDVIASRVLALDNGREVLIQVYAPKQDRSQRDTEYQSRFEVRNLTEAPIKGAGRGVDSLQALQNALQELGATLKPYRTRLTWFGAPWLGLPRAIPSGFGDEIDAEYEKAVEAVTTRVSRRLERRLQRSQPLRRNRRRQARRRRR